MEGKKVPQYLSSPYQLLWFEADDLAIMVVFFLLALMFGGWLLYVSIIAGPVIYGKIKHSYPRGFIKHIMYFTGLVGIKKYPGFWETFFVE